MQSTTNVGKRIKQYGARIDTMLRRAIPRGAKDFLSEPVWHHLSTGGKRIRPALCLITCEAAGGDARKAMNFALATELLHNMLLLHDDIEDGDKIRRDAPTVWVAFGVANGINAGDYLLAKAYQCVGATRASDRIKSRLTEVFTTALERTIEGQALDINWRARPDFTVQKYMRIITLKTGHYLALPIIGGALIAGAGKSTVEKLASLGESLGPAFQIRDDIIDLTKGKGRGGQLGSDIKEGKPSILFAHALSKASPHQKKRLVAVMKRPRQKTTQADIRWVIDLYERCGSLDFAQKKADRLAKKALAIIDAIPLRKKQLFRDIISFVVERNS